MQVARVMAAVTARVHSRASSQQASLMPRGFAPLGLKPARSVGFDGQCLHTRAAPSDKEGIRNGAWDGGAQSDRHSTHQNNVPDIHGKAEQENRGESGVLTAFCDAIRRSAEPPNRLSIFSLTTL